MEEGIIYRGGRALPAGESFLPHSRGEPSGPWPRFTKRQSAEAEEDSDLLRQQLEKFAGENKYANPPESGVFDLREVKDEIPR